jgi:hypothetical protein
MFESHIWKKETLMKGREDFEMGFVFGAIAISLLFALLLVILASCGHGMSNGNLVGGLVLKEETKRQLLKEKEGCEKLGGEFSVKVDKEKADPIDGIICNFTGSR